MAIYQDVRNAQDRCKSQLSISPFRNLQKSAHFEVTFSPTDVEQKIEDTTSSVSRDYVSKIPKFANKPRQITPSSSIRERDLSNSKIPKFSGMGSPS